MKTEDFFIILLKTIGIYTLCNYVLNNYMIVYSITEQDWRWLISFIGFTLVYRIYNLFDKNRQGFQIDKRDRNGFYFIWDIK